ncbi:cytochrome c-type biogenesis protein [Bradymonas sediminis]|uniref:Cytochrome c-type biogenesis protein n=1 Tax=Bradymonas sediminis TaxID=1548548 RepID=A0A2Z4FNH2_9DELT|nr:cytochrome c-type biogenesis protein CcmH [Bradymonas sediminis]AWV90264.1 hypothetical protein DN745_13360 [Bradymonas sediminis]TDP75767.1 cytochrome c-type biogenesis protein CcmH/NrfF [Bradymonas sediminis]
MKRMTQQAPSTRPAHHMRRIAAVFLLMILSVGSVSPVAAAPPEGASASAAAPRTPGAASTLSQQIGQEIYSPFCPGKTLEMCPSGQASEVRQDIQEMALQGMPKQEIIDTIVGDIGEKYRVVAPPAEDDYMLLGIIFAALLLCLVAIYFFGWRGRKKGGLDDGEEAVSAEDLSEEDRLYLEELRGEYLE